MTLPETQKLWGNNTGRQTKLASQRSDVAKVKEIVTFSAGIADLLLPQTSLR